MLNKELLFLKVVVSDLGSPQLSATTTLIMNIVLSSGQPVFAPATIPVLVPQSKVLILKHRHCLIIVVINLADMLARFTLSPSRNYIHSSECFLAVSYNDQSPTADSFDRESFALFQDYPVLIISSWDNPVKPFHLQKDCSQ